MNDPFSKRLHIIWSTPHLLHMGILRIAKTSLDQIILEISSLFQIFPSSVINSLTIAFAFSTATRDCTQKEFSVGSHFLNQILILAPFPTCQCMPICMISLAAEMLFHIGDAVPLTWPPLHSHI